MYDCILQLVLVNLRGRISQCVDVFEVEYGINLSGLFVDVDSDKSKPCHCVSEVGDKIVNPHHVDRLDVEAVVSELVDCADLSGLDLNESYASVHLPNACIDDAVQSKNCIQVDDLMDEDEAINCILDLPSTSFMHSSPKVAESDYDICYGVVRKLLSDVEFNEDFEGFDASMDSFLNLSDGGFERLDAEAADDGVICRVGVNGLCGNIDSLKDDSGVDGGRPISSNSGQSDVDGSGLVCDEAREGGFLNISGVDDFDEELQHRRGTDVEDDESDYSEKDEYEQDSFVVSDDYESSPSPPSRRKRGKKRKSTSFVADGKKMCRRRILSSSSEDGD